MSYYCIISLLVCIVLGYSIPVSASVTVTEDQTVASKFIRHTVTGITTSTPVAPDVTGFPGASYLTIGDIDNDGKKEIICTSGVGIDGDIYSAGKTALLQFSKEMAAASTTGHKLLSTRLLPSPMRRFCVIWMVMETWILW